jgi:hypothetical protein
MNSSSVSKPERYKYKPLQRGCIRVLSVHPNHANASADTIICSLNQVDTKENPTYHCLSYTWGSPLSFIGSIPSQNTLQRYVICNGSHIEVTESLFTALTTLRNEAPEQLRCIWIDAICINQEDIPEGSNQVARMGSIYSSAASVIVWLGPSDDFVPAGLDTIPLIKSQGPEILQTLKRIENEGSNPKSQISSLLEFVSAHQWVQSAHLFRRSWFTRIWVIQEVVLAKSIKVYYGKYELSWEDLELLSISTRVVGDQFLDDSLLNPLEPDRDVNVAIRREIRYRIFNITILVELRELWNQDRGIDARDFEWQVLRKLRGYFSCTDPRDYVYGLYGLLVDDKNVAPDYTKPVAEVFTDFIGSSIRRAQNLNILRYVEDASQRRLKSLPSWVPDLSSRLGPTSLTRLSRSWASKSLRPQDHPTVEAGILSITSICLGSIDKTAWVPEDALRSLTEAKGVLKLLQFLADLPVLFHNGEERVSLFNNLLKESRIIDKSPPDPLYMILGVMVVRALEMDRKREVEEEIFEQFVKHLHEHDTLGLMPSWEQVEELRGSFLEINSQIFEIDQEWLTAMKQHPITSGEFELLPGQRNIFYTSTGQMGFGHLSIQEGDQVWISPCSNTPLILRRLVNGNYRFVGEAYVHEIMHDEVDGSEQRLQNISIE